MFGVSSLGTIHTSYNVALQPPERSSRPKATSSSAFILGYTGVKPVFARNSAYQRVNTQAQSPTGDASRTRLWYSALAHHHRPPPSPRLLPSIFSSLATPCCSTEVTGHDSTLYLPASKLIISQTFHYVNQTTASHYLHLLHHRFPPLSLSLSLSLSFSLSIASISPVHLHVSIRQHSRVAGNGETRRYLFRIGEGKGCARETEYYPSRNLRYART